MALDVELSETRDFLAHHEPFDALPDAVLDALPARMSVEYFRRGTRLIERGRDNHHLYVLRSGAAEVHDAQGSLVDRGGEGSCFGSITLTQGNPSTFDVTAIEDSLALLLPAEDFHRLCTDHPEVGSFFDAQRASRMSGAVASLQLSSTGSAILKTRVRDLVGREPVAVTTTATVRDAARTMSEHGVSSLLVMDGERLAGIITDRDLRTRVLAAGVDPGGGGDRGDDRRPGDRRGRRARLRGAARDDRSAHPPPADRRRRRPAGRHRHHDRPAAPRAGQPGLPRR